ncbi:hypothetical protein SDC9_184336 [bioreactor metagenome]|uniref:Uncharacterized protein n=1 Tax=bioreactor metagenome TaxID=1076179 RepID=A0A645HL06_9ZZZZ
MLVPVLSQRGIPVVGGERDIRVVGVQGGETIDVVIGGQQHPAEDRIAHQRGERPQIAGERPRPPGHRLFARLGVGGIGQGLPFVHQAGVGGPDQFAQPGDQIV